MPQRLKKPCNKPGCRNLTLERFCDEHKKQHQRQQDERRGSAHERGYNHRWRQYSKRYLKAHPLCMCAECAKLMVPLPSQVVDHIKPHKGEYALFWDPRNHQALNKRCHDRKTVKEDGGFGNG